MAYEVTIEKTYSDGTYVKVVGNTDSEAVIAFQNTYALLTYKPDPAPTPDPPV